jgi:L-amino acid N-acyltransferase YncA
MPHSPPVIRPATPDDFAVIWAIFQAVVAAGDTFAFTAATTREQFAALWLNPPAHAYVALREGRVAGSYYLKPNQPGLGDHVANGGYMVDPAARGGGVGRAMGAHSIDEARRLGFSAMQFNFVVASNPAVKLWQELGFAIVGTVSGAFRHARLGPTAIHLMHRAL